jgi:hypothetical protein
MEGVGASLPAIRLLNQAREKRGLYPLVIHDNYLINLASAHEKTRELSIEAFRGELVRAVAIGAEYLVAHPGNYKGHTVEQGIMHFLEGVGKAARGLDLGKLMLLIENTVGAGAQLGGRFEELHVMREFAPTITDIPIGSCLDTCHLLASGSTSRVLTVSRTCWRRRIGSPARKCPRDYANDSKGALGSHINRYQHRQRVYGLAARRISSIRSPPKAFIFKRRWTLWDRKISTPSRPPGEKPTTQRAMTTTNELSGTSAEQRSNLKAEVDSKRPKYCVLEMLPHPSGSPHIGHCEITPRRCTRALHG